MRVFMVEFVTGGGMRAEALPRSLVREGALMRDALVRDLAELPGVELVTTHDDRVEAPACDARAIHEGDDPWAVWAELAGDADVAWVVAPETGGALARLTRLARNGGAMVIGPDDEAIRVASSKRLTGLRLASKGIATPPIWRPGEVPPEAAGPFVVKPDGGAGCDATILVDEAPTALELEIAVQVFVPGDAASLTVLREDGVTRLLSANRQLVSIEDGAFSFRGLVVGAIEDADGRLAALAEAVTEALPGLSGIFGIDVVIGADGPVVIEINPRLTTAYAGLREALGVNPASLVAPFAVTRNETPLRHRAVEIAL